MNLSPSALGKKEGRRGIFDTSFIAVLIIFFLVLAGWGGMRWYIQKLDDKLTGIEAEIEKNSLQLQGENVDRVANFGVRLELIDKQSKSSAVDSQKLLSQLESLAVPSVRLTEYKYNEAEKTVTVSGETDTFRYVAQQMVSLKSESLFAGIKVETLTRTKEGRIAFSFKARFN